MKHAVLDLRVRCEESWERFEKAESSEDREPDLLEKEPVRTQQAQDFRKRRSRTRNNLAKAAPVKSTIPIEVLDRVDIRVGMIELVEDVPKSERLVRLTVDFGDHKRRIVVGMKQERSNPKEVEGRQALFVVNLTPRRIMKEVSEGMLLDIGHVDGITSVLAVPEKWVPNGTRAA